MGLVDGGSLGLWQAVTPAAGVNWVSNPSFEVSTTGWTATSSTLTRTAGGTFGAWLGRLLASATNGRAEFSGPQLSAGTLVVASAWVKATSTSVILRLAYGGTTYDQAHPGDGLWHRLEVAGTAVAATTPVIGIRDGRSSAWANVDIDGVQFETGVTSATTYLDGDQDGGVWDGSAGLSVSRRNGRSGQGGVIASFDAAGVLVMTQQGIGAPTVDVATQNLAIKDGSVYQRTLKKERVITLTALVQGSGTTAGLHTARRAAQALVNPENRSARGPVLLRYTGAAVTKRLAAYYEGGLEWGDIDAANEKVPLRFLAPDPDWQAETDEQVQLVGSIVSSVAGTSGGVLQRDLDGNWSTLNGGMAGLNTGSVFQPIHGPDGSLYVYGAFSGPATGGTDPANFAKWDTATSTWVSLGAKNPVGQLYAVAFSPSGRIAIGGIFTSVGGVANTPCIAEWTGSAWVSLGGAGTNNYVGGLVYDQNGQLWATGGFTQIGATVAPGTAQWNGSAWIALDDAGAAVFGLSVGPDGFIYGFSAADVMQYGAAWASIGTVSGGSLQYVRWTSKGLYALGGFTSINGIACDGAALWNGAAWEALATTHTGAAPGFLFGAPAPDGSLHAIGPLADGGTLDGSIIVWDGMVYNGSTWVTEDLYLGANAVGFGVALSPTGLLTVTYNTTSGASDTRVLPGLTTVTNSGSAAAYPVIRFDDPDGGVLYSLSNLTTGQAIRFNRVSQYPGEIVILDLRPGRKSFKSTSRDLLSFVLPGSDLDTFCLAPGTNIIQVFGTQSVTTASMYWRARYWSAD